MFTHIKLGVVLGVCLFLTPVAQAASGSSTAATSATTTPTTTASTSRQTPAETEKKVREYFADKPVMIEIAKCESKFRQFTDAGNVLRGGSGGMMVGVFQFFESVHTTAAKKLGFDLLTVEGNIGYAKHVYAQSGTTPWVSCVPEVVPVATVMSAANKELQIKLLTKVVELLTELLKIELAKQK